MANFPITSKTMIPAALEWVAFALAAAWAISLGGCGSGNQEIAPVRGRVTIGGKGVAGGTIVFYPEKGRPAIGELDADGRYRLTTFSTGDGALLGNHQVTIRALESTIAVGGATSAEEELRGVPMTPENAPQSPTWIVPERYADRETSPLKATVRASGNTIDFDVPAKP